MSDPKMKSAAKTKGVSPLNRVTAGRFVATGAKPKTETVTVISGTKAQPKIKRVTVAKTLFTTFPSQKSLDFMRRSDEATSGGVRLFGRRRGL